MKIVNYPLYDKKSLPHERQSGFDILDNVDIFHSKKVIIDSYIGTIEELTGKRITELALLDLGCSARAYSDPKKEKIDREESNQGTITFEPWFCRAIYQLGGKIIGIDGGDLSKEKFKHYTLDLIKPESLSMFETRSIDVACAFRFFTSPSLIGHDTTRMRKIITEQLERIVKPEGFFLINDI